MFIRPRQPGHVAAHVLPSSARRRAQVITPVLNKTRHLPLLWPFNRRLLYVGWLGHFNMGDEIMYLAHRSAFPEYCLVKEVPRPNRLALLDALTPHRLLEAVMLGGRTLIGSSRYRNALARVFSVYDTLPAFMLGTGVEDPSFHTADQPRGSHELRQWEQILPRFHKIAVRGPHSQAILAEHGLQAEVVGDPALLLADDEPSHDFVERLIGVNLGGFKTLWGNNPELVLEQMIGFLRRMIRRGWTIRFIPVSPQDMPYVCEAARQIGSAVQVFGNYTCAESLFKAIRECHVFIGQKLHSVVFSSAVYVPCLMLEYQPKCADFQASLNREAFTVRTDVIKIDELLDKVDDLAENRDDHCRALLRAVSLRRTQLQNEVQEIRAVLAGGMPPDANGSGR